MFAGAGLGGFCNCNHVGGVLFALEDFNRKGYQDCPEPVYCTSRLSAWNVPTSFMSISRDENKWLILEGPGRMKIPTFSEKSLLTSKSTVPTKLIFLIA